MPNELGFSFAPGSRSVGMGQAAQPSLQPPTAVEYRNLRIPNRMVPGQIAPQALLQARGGQGVPDVQLLQQLMAIFAPQGAQPGLPQMAGMPSGGMQGAQGGFSPQMPTFAAGDQSARQSQAPRIGAGGTTDLLQGDARAANLAGGGSGLLPGDGGPYPNTGGITVTHQPPSDGGAQSLFNEAPSIRGRWPKAGLGIF